MAGGLLEATSSANEELSRVEESTARLAFFFANFAAHAACAFALHCFTAVPPMVEREQVAEVAVEVPTASYKYIGINHTISRTVFVIDNATTKESPIDVCTQR